MALLASKPSAANRAPVHTGISHRPHRKNLSLALDAARELGLSLPNTATAMQLFNSCAAQEHGGSLDHSAMIMALETLARHGIA